MKLNKDLLTDQGPSGFSDDYKSGYSSRGSYDSMQFVLRLDPNLHAKLEQVAPGIVTPVDYDFETFQAFSTYLHETIHWWQHINKNRDSAR